MKQWRINLVLFLIFLFGAAIVGRLIFIQVLNHQYWRALAQGQQKFFLISQGERGEIFFPDGRKLATNQIIDLIYVSPNEIEDRKKTAEILSAILGLDENSILEKLKKNNSYEVIKKNLTKEELSELKKIKISGVYLGKKSERYYPFGTLAAQTLGFLGGDNKGQYGIEGFYDDILRGKEKFLEKEKGPGGYLISQLVPEPEKGSDIILTLDYNIQFMAEKLLKEAKNNLDIESGEIIVMEPGSGKILALANFPGFDPNRYFEENSLEIFQNSALQKLFEPGSVFKPITMAAALDLGKITPQTTYYDTGSVKIGGYTIYNYDNRVWGKRTMTEVLEKSINTGAVFASQQISHEDFISYIDSFGIFEPTGVDLQSEVFSQNKEFKKGYEINFATASFGQGIKMNSLQLIRAFSVIANAGKLVKPYIVAQILQNGKKNETRPEIQNSLVISPSTASQLTMMLVSTVDNGFSKRAKIEGYYIAGKTGTAQIPYEEKRGYYPDKTIQSFVGFGPALDPKFLILVKLYNPKTKTAEYSAVPIFRNLAKYIIDLWQIPPDYGP